MSAKVLFVGRDLSARARLEGAGAQVTPVAPERVTDALRAADFDALVIDLDSGRAEAIAAAAAARAEGVAPARVLGYFSHVDDELGRAARAAGIEALPRGRFWTRLGELVGDG